MHCVTFVKKENAITVLIKSRNAIKEELYSLEKRLELVTQESKSFASTPRMVFSLGSDTMVK